MKYPSSDQGDVVAVEQRVEKMREPGNPADEPEIKFFALVDVDDPQRNGLYPEKIEEEEFLEAFRTADQEDITTWKDQAKHQVDPVAPDRVTDIQTTAGIRVELEGGE